MKEPEELYDKGTPGSDEAIRNGCECPILDNGHGNGIIMNVNNEQRKVFWISEICPLHGKENEKSRV